MHFMGNEEEKEDSEEVLDSTVANYSLRLENEDTYKIGLDINYCFLTLCTGGLNWTNFGGT